MPLVRLRRASQITLPAEIRDALGLSEGDYLEAEVTAGGVLLKPVSVVERERAWNDLVRIVDRPKRRRPTAKTPREDEEDIAKAVKAHRRAHAQGRHR